MRVGGTLKTMQIWEGVVERLQDVGFATWASLAGCVHQIKINSKHAAWSIAFYLSGVGCYKTKRQRSEFGFTVSITSALLNPP